MSAKREPSGEDKLIERFFKPLASHPGALSLSDDAAFLSPRAGYDLVLTADTIVGGVHFFPDDPAGTIAKKALRVNLSDLAAKGAEPVGALLAISLPWTLGETWIADFSRGLGEDCAAFSCPLLGGDTTKTPGPLSITITAIGDVPSGTMVKRGGAKPGDLVVVSGMVGDAALGLRVLKGDAALLQLSRDQLDYLKIRYRVPEPRLALAPLLRMFAHAAMDVSDGLLGDLAKLCAVSGLGAQIEIARLPLSNPAYDALEFVPGYIDPVLTGGDDYEVLAAIPEDAFREFAEQAGASGVPVTAIGRFESEEGVRATGPGGEELSFGTGSYSHF